MLFNSVKYIVFFPVVLIGCRFLPKKCRCSWLLLTSYFFYMNWNAGYALLLLASTAVTYVGGLLLEKINGSQEDTKKKSGKKKAVVGVSFFIVLGMLFFFKYYGMFADLVNVAAERNGERTVLPQPDILLPVGISFYTFQSLGYTADVYKNKISAERNFIRYALFVSFFPQLVAGPIERPGDLLPQLERDFSASSEEISEGFFRILWGFFMKTVIADRAALFVDTVYGSTTVYHGVFLIAATLLFAVQIYCDFAGYSHIAVGSAKMLGIGLSENFDAPYLSSSVSEFWKKWHITLNRWFREHLYIPMGGNRKGKIRTHINKMTVFLVSGLWHGADLSFVVWGALNGLWQFADELTSPLRKVVSGRCRGRVPKALFRLAGGVATFILTDITWVFFRAENLAQAMEILRLIVRTDNYSVLFNGSLFDCGLDKKNFYFLIACIGILAVTDILKKKRKDVFAGIVKRKLAIRCLLAAAGIVFLMVFGIFGDFSKEQFIYFRF